MRLPTFHPTSVFILLLFAVSIAFGAQGDVLDPRFEQLNELVRDPASPIKFNAKMNEYNLTYTNVILGVTAVHSVRLTFCPFTGKKLPPSKRASFFMKPSPEEMKKYQNLLSGVSSIAEVKKRLGEPDKVYKGFEDIRQQLTYSSKAKTLSIVVQEGKDGLVTVTYMPKEK